MCVVVSGRWLDALVSLVWLLSDLRTRGTGSNPCLHQPPTTKQWVSLQWARERDPGMSYSSLSGFVHTHKCHSYTVFVCLLQEKQFIFALIVLTPCLQMTFVPGRHGPHVPGAVVRGLCHVAGRVCVRRVEIRHVPLRLRLRGTERRRSCVTNSPVPVRADLSPQRTIEKVVCLINFGHTLPLCPAIVKQCTSEFHIVDTVHDLSDSHLGHMQSWSYIPFHELFV